MALGEILREARTRKGWSVARLAEATRMMTQIVEDIEREDFRRIAAPIYGRGFIKLYAEHVGLDPDPLIQEFVEIYTGAHAPVVARRSVATQEPEPTTPPPAACAHAPSPVAAPIDPPETAVGDDDDLFTAAAARATPQASSDATHPSPPRVSPVAVRSVRRPMPAKPTLAPPVAVSPVAAPQPSPGPGASGAVPPVTAPVAPQPSLSAPAAAPAVPPPPRRRSPGAPAAMPPATAPAAVSTVSAASVAPRRSPSTPAAITAGLRRLWGDFNWPSGWSARRKWVLLVAGLLLTGILGYGVRQLLQTPAHNAGRSAEPFSRQILPPPDPYVD